MSTNVRVEIALYDLLPASRLARAFWYLGCGIYHTAVRIPELGVEFAYGGLLPSSGTRGNDVTGVFSIPSPGDPAVVERLMPGLRFIERRVVGEAFGTAWAERYGQAQGGQASFLENGHLSDKPLPPIPSTSSARRFPKMARELSSSSISGTPLLRSSSSGDTTEEDGNSTLLNETFDADEWGRKYASRDEHVAGDSPSSPPFRDTDEQKGRRPVSSDLTRILAVIDKIKSEPEWRATRYSLLSKNCNNFTDELCMRLTGRGAPAWINRAAWVGKSLPCLVPQDWLEPPLADDIYDSPSVTRAPRGIRDDVVREERPLSPLIAIPYIETQPMSIGLGFEGVQETATKYI